MLVPNIVGVLRSMLVELDVLYSLLGWHLLGRGRFGYYLGYSGCAQQLLLVRAVMVIALKNGGNLGIWLSQRAMDVPARGYR